MTEPFKQAAEKFNTAGSVLVVLPPMASADAVAAGLALSAFLKKTDKDAVVVSSDGLLNPQVDFLPGYGQVMRTLSLTKGFVIDVSTKRAEISELTYKKEGDKISVYLRPKSGEYAPEDVTFRNSKFPYDAVVVLGADKLESLGQFYSRNAELFFETPVVNIDHRGSNTNYGQFNLVNLNASSLSEITFDLISEMERDLVDQDVATSLLAGIISETNSFQHSKTTPQAFRKASELVALGGQQQDIVTNLYRNKSMGLLKLWGRALARLKTEQANLLASSTITLDDVVKSGATESDVAGLLKEMVQQLTFAKVHTFFRELPNAESEVFCSAPASLGLASLFSQYQASSTLPQSMRFTVPLPFSQAEQQIMGVLRQQSAKLTA